MDSIQTSADFLINLCDCVSQANAGDPTVRQVFDRWPSANVYRNRKKSCPGQIEIRVVENGPRIINLFAQQYPGPSRYPNDDATRRLKWFREGLDRFLNLLNHHCTVSFPPDLGLVYLEAIDDFKKKAFLKDLEIKLVDYQDQPYPQSEEDRPPSVDQPKELDLYQADYRIKQVFLPKLKVVKQIDLDKLRYVSQIPSVPVSTSKPKPKLSLKPTNLVDQIKVQEEERVVPPQPPQTTTGPKKKKIVRKLKGSARSLLDLPKYVKNPVHYSWESLFNHPIIVEHLTRISQLLPLDSWQEKNYLPAEPHLVFNAFSLCPFPPKVVILGQDPYFSNKNEAMGLSFSVPQGVTIPPSLRNIYKEIGIENPTSGDLTPWAKQGVLLLNTALTVVHGQKLAHMDHWDTFTNDLLGLISRESAQPIIFLLWGNPARSRKSAITSDRGHTILESVHPSPLSASRGWFGCGHFTETNRILEERGLKPIDWSKAV